MSPIKRRVEALERASPSGGKDLGRLHIVAGPPAGATEAEAETYIAGKRIEVGAAPNDMMVLLVGQMKRGSHGSPENTGEKRDGDPR